MHRVHTVVFINQTKIKSNTTFIVSDILKVKITLEQATRAQKGEGRGIALLFLNLGARGGWVVNATPRPLYPRERPGNHCIGGWAGPRAGLYGCGKSRPPPGFDPRTVQVTHYLR